MSHTNNFAGVKAKNDEQAKGTSFATPMLALALARALPPRRAPRRPSLTTRLQQVWRAARAAGVEVAVTVEGDKLTATPLRGNALGEPERDDPFANPWDQVYAADQKRPS
jgi:hypothetical protein